MGARYGASALLALGAAPALAQETVPADPPVTFDLERARQGADRDPVLERKCEDEADAAQITGEIVVCRNLGRDSDDAFDKAEWERRYAERTQGPVAPDVDGTGIKLPTEGSIISVTVTVKGKNAKPPPVMIDVGALPEAPVESDADRVGQGLFPLEPE